MRQDYYRYIEISELHLRDKVWSLGFGDEVVQRIFTVVDGIVRPYDYKDDVQMAITFELNRDLRMVHRQVYMFMDWLGDIGGLSGSLYAIFGLVVMVFQYKVVYNYIATNTYQTRDKTNRKPKTSSSPQK